jgi:formylglycine-generating enzyme required for sulfatase activity
MVTGGSQVFIADRDISLAPFYIAEYETTYTLWKEVYNWAVANGYFFANEGMEGHGWVSGAGGTSMEPNATLKASRPVTTISWRDAIVWCNAYSQKTGRQPVYYAGSVVLKDSTGTSADAATMDTSKNGYRLPTEAEWEYAARGGDPDNTTNWNYLYAGSGTLSQVAWYYDNSATLGDTNADYGPHPVGIKNAPNSLGLHDMSGNVWEWCWDKTATYGNITTATPADGETTGAHRVLRGGAWNAEEAYCTVSHRNNTTPSGYTSAANGFRVVCKP